VILALRLQQIYHYYKNPEIATIKNRKDNIKVTFQEPADLKLINIDDFEDHDKVDDVVIDPEVESYLQDEPQNADESGYQDSELNSGDQSTALKSAPQSQDRTRAQQQVLVTPADFVNNKATRDTHLNQPSAQQIGDSGYSQTRGPQDPPRHSQPGASRASLPPLARPRTPPHQQSNSKNQRPSLLQTIHKKELLTSLKNVGKENGPFSYSSASSQTFPSTESASVSASASLTQPLVSSSAQKSIPPVPKHLNSVGMPVNVQSIFPPLFNKNPGTNIKIQTQSESSVSAVNLDASSLPKDVMDISQAQILRFKDYIPKTTANPNGSSSHSSSYR
jgi:hypothetical protein